MERILAKLGYERIFEYDKFREEYGEPGGPGVITLDETPIGNFIELEGMPDWIDGTAALLGFERGDYIIASYRSFLPRLLRRARNSAVEYDDRQKGKKRKT